MANDNLVLYVASYDDAGSAEADFKSLKDAQAAGDFASLQERGRRAARIRLEDI